MLYLSVGQAPLKYFRHELQLNATENASNRTETKLNFISEAAEIIESPNGLLSSTPVGVGVGLEVDELSSDVDLVMVVEGLDADVWVIEWLLVGMDEADVAGCVDTDVELESVAPDLVPKPIRLLSKSSTV